MAVPFPCPRWLISSMIAQLVTCFLQVVAEQEHVKHIIQGRHGPASKILLKSHLFPSAHAEVEVIENGRSLSTCAWP